MAPLITDPTVKQVLKCVPLALNLMPNSYLNSIMASMDLAINTLEAMMALLEAQLLSLFGFSQALQAQKAMILNVIQGYQSQLNIIDMSIVNQCPVLGQVNQVVTGTVETYLAPVKAIINQIDCFNRIYLEYQDKKALIQAQIDMLKQVRTAIQSVLDLRAAAIMTVNMTTGQV